MPQKHILERSEDLKKVLAEAQAHAKSLGHKRVDLLHLFLGLLDVKASFGFFIIERLIMEAGKSFKELEVHIDCSYQIGNGSISGRDLPMNKTARVALNFAYGEAEELGGEETQVSTELLLLGLFTTESSFVESLAQFGLTYSALMSEVNAYHDLKFVEVDNPHS